MKEFAIDEIMKLTNVNPRNEKHGDSEVLSVDLTLSATFDADEIGLLMTSIDMESFKKTFWHDSGHPIAEHHLQLVTALEDYQVNVRKGQKMLLASDDATVKGFKIEFNHGHTVNLSFKVQCNTSGKAIGNVSESLNDDVQVVIESGPQEEMDLQQDGGPIGASEDNVTPIQK